MPKPQDERLLERLRNLAQEISDIAVDLSRRPSDFDIPYRGYRNYETFLVASVICYNEEVFRMHNLETDQDHDVREVAQKLETYIRAANPISVENSPFYMALVNHALDLVDWLEITNNFLTNHWPDAVRNNKFEGL